MNARLTRACMSDHQRSKLKAQREGDIWLALIVGVLALGAILKLLRVIP